MNKLYQLNPFTFRSLFRAIIIYFTFCRFADFTKLTDKQFTDGGDFIKIVFLTRKNDQLGNNSEHVIASRTDCSVCPVEFIRCYFHRFGLRFGGEGHFVNFRLHKQAGRYSADHSRRLSAGTATKWTRRLLQKHGYEASTFTEKSLKVGGVTSLLDAGEPLENVQVAGGWHSLQMPQYYRNTSLAFKKGISARLPVEGPDELVKEHNRS
jgi:hypothetical protein